MHTLTVT